MGSTRSTAPFTSALMVLPLYGTKDFSHPELNSKISLVLMLHKITAS